MKQRYLTAHCKVRAVITSDLKDKGHNDVKGFISSVLKMKILDIETSFGASFNPHSD